MAAQKLDIKVGRSDGYYTVSIPALGIADFGKTKKELMKNLNSALSLALSNMIESKEASVVACSMCISKMLKTINSFHAV